MLMDSKGKYKTKIIGFRYALKGLREVIRTEFNFKVHLLISTATLILAFLLNVSAIEWAVLLLTMSLVLTLEMINSVIERIMDYLAPEYDPKVGVIKDVAAGAVLIAATFSVVIGLIIFGEKLITIFT